MKITDTFWLGYRGLSDKKTRTALTILMVVIGVASIIALVSQTVGIQASINNSLLAIGPTSISITPAAGTQLTDADVSRLQSIPGVEAVVPIITSQAILLNTGGAGSASIIGVSNAGLESLIGNVKLIEGGIYPDNSAPLVVAGYNVAFPSTSGGRQEVQIGQPLIMQQTLGQASRTLSFTVSGLLQAYGSISIIPVDSSIFISLDAARLMFHRFNYNVILVKAVDVKSVASVAQFISDIYGSSATVTTIQQITQTVSSITGFLGILLGAIAGISLTVAAVGIMNIMFVSVLERTKEIGIMKALGFQNGQVLIIFLSEAILIGLVGGILGIGAGASASYVIPLLLAGISVGGGNAGAGARGAGGTSPSAFGGEQGFSLSYTPIISPDIVAVSIIVAVIVSVIAGLYPAWRASRMQPIKALRYE